MASGIQCKNRGMGTFNADDRFMGVLPLYPSIHGCRVDKVKHIITF